MMPSLPRPDCSVDAEGCIDWVFVNIGEFLKNGYTMTLLVLTLIALLRVRAQERRKIRERYHASMLRFEEKRVEEVHSPGTWVSDDSGIRPEQSVK